jgi:hypothetical protein
MDTQQRAAADTPSSSLSHLHGLQARQKQERRKHLIKSLLILLQRMLQYKPEELKHHHRSMHTSTASI